MFLSYGTYIVSVLIAFNASLSKAPFLVFCLRCNAEEVVFKSHCGECFLTQLKHGEGREAGQVNVRIS